MPYYQPRYDFAYIPAGRQLALADCAKHEYFGEDFVAGESTLGIFKTETGRLRAIWSYGDWNSYDCKPGQSYGFQHTQNQRITYLKFVATLTHEQLALLDEEDLVAKVPHWTLK